MLTICSVFLATTLLALLSFISLELAALTFLIGAAGTLLYAENRRRNFQDLAAAFKFKTLKDGLKALREDLGRNSRGLAALKDDLEETKTRIARMKQAAPPPEKKKSEPLPSSLPPDFYDLAGGKAAGAKPAFRQPPHTPAPPADMPRALKAGQAGPVQDIEPITINPPLENEPPHAFEQGEDPDSFSDTIVLELLRHAVGSKRIEVFVQPVMRLPQRQARFYEIYARIRARPGEYIPAARYMKLAEQDNLHRDIDVLLLLHGLKTIEESEQIERAAPFFINITSETLKNGIFMKQLLGFLARNRHLAPRLIFEIPHRHFTALPPSLLEIMRGLGRLDCSFSLDHVETLDLDIAGLQDLKIRFVKIDAALLLSAQGREKEAAALGRARRKLEANGIGVIAQRVESEAQLRQLLDINLHYGQGFLFGKPEPQGAYADRTRARRKGLAGDDQKTYA